MITITLIILKIRIIDWIDTVYMNNTVGCIIHGQNINAFWHFKNNSWNSLIDHFIITFTTWFYYVSINYSSHWQWQISSQHSYFVFSFYCCNHPSPPISQLPSPTTFDIALINFLTILQLHRQTLATQQASRKTIFFSCLKVSMQVRSGFSTSVISRLVKFFLSASSLHFLQQLKSETEIERELR